MIRPLRASVVVLLSTLLVSGCDNTPTVTPLAPEAGARAKHVTKTHGASPDRVGPLPDAWVEPSDKLRVSAIDGGIAVTDPDQMLRGLELWVDPCRDLNDLTVRVAMVMDGEVVATGDSEGGVGAVIEEDFPGLDPGSETGVTGPGTPACAGQREPIRLSASAEADGPRVVWPDPDNWWPNPDQRYPNPDEWDGEIDSWIPVGELIPDPNTRSDWPAKQWSFLKAKKAFLQAKKAFIPATVVFDAAREWFPGDDTPIIANGGFGPRAEDGQPRLDGPVIVVGVMPGDNVSARNGDRVGVTFFAPGPGDDD